MVSVDEHGNEEAQEENLENIDKNENEDFTLWLLILREVLSTIDTVEDVKDSLVDTWDFNFELSVELSSDDDERKHNRPKGNHELL